MMKPYFHSGFIVALLSMIPILAQPGHSEPVRYALYDCTIIDGMGRPPLKGSVILISDGKIEQVGPKKKLAMPRGYSMLDLKGRTVVPGFINAHVHAAYDTANLRRWLKAGITTVRDLSPLRVADFLQIRNRFNRAGRYPRIISSSRMLTKSGGYGGEFVDTPQEAEQKVNSCLDQGVDIIKLSIEDDCQQRQWPMLTGEEVKRIVSAAHARSVKVSAHITHARNIQSGIDAGIDDIAHMVTEPLTDGLVKELVAKAIGWTPTLELWKGVSDRYRRYGINFDSVAVANVRKFHAAGGRIALGTDFGGYNCAFDQGFPMTEVLLLQSAGLSPMDIIIAATHNAAWVCNLDKELGAVEPGKTADLVVLKGDPLQDIRLLSEPYLIMHKGKIID